MLRGVKGDTSVCGLSPSGYLNGGVEAGVGSCSVAGGDSHSLKLRWFRMRMVGWGVGSLTPTVGFPCISWGAELSGRLDQSLWFAFLMGTFNGMALVNLSLQTQVCMSSFSLFSINYLNITSEPLFHQEGRRFNLSHCESHTPLASCQGSWFWDPSRSSGDAPVFPVSLVLSALLLGHIQATHRHGTLGRSWSPGPQHPACLLLHVADPTEILLYTWGRDGILLWWNPPCLSCSPLRVVGLPPCLPCSPQEILFQLFSSVDYGNKSLERKHLVINFFYTKLLESRQGCIEQATFLM